MLCDNVKMFEDFTRERIRRCIGLMIERAYIGDVFRSLPLLALQVVEAVRI